VMEGIQWSNRIVKYAEVDPRSLLANEQNWRTHPLYQRKVVRGALEKIGWLQDIIVNLRQCEGWQKGEYGIETVVDGHLRVLEALESDQASVPVKYVNLTPEEEKAALLILDPSAALALADKERLRDLIEHVEPLNIEMEQMLIDLAEKYRVEFDGNVLESDDEFADFSDYGAQNESEFVAFKFGDYSGKVSADIYELFEKRVRELKRETSAVLLDDVLRIWLFKDRAIAEESERMAG